MGTLTLVGTTLGNSEDISIRALRTISSAEVVFAEDTRVFKKFQKIIQEKYGATLQSLNISNVSQQIFSYREQNHKRIVPQVLSMLNQAKSVILVSDAGMPVISDPGYQLIDIILAHGHEVDTIPGATAMTTALAISGLPTEPATFLGFLPRRKSRIQKVIAPFLDAGSTVIFYESPYRVAKTFEALLPLQSEAQEIRVAACTELTKKFQKVYRGTIQEVLDQLSKSTLKGEWTVCVRRVD